MPKKLFYLAALLLSAACSDQDGGLSASGKDLALKISGSRSFNPNVVHGQIQYYEITVTGPDLNLPFTHRFDGATSTASLLGIPSGTDRTISVEAVNPNGLVIRRGKKEGVAILPGQVSRAEISMMAVPIFTNIADKAAVSGPRLGFQFFAEPGSSLQVFREDGNGEEVLADRETGKAWVDTQSNADGLFSLAPPVMDYGPHVFIVKDMETSEFSRIAVTLYRQTVRPGIGANSGGSAGNQGDELVLSGIGQPYFRKVSLEDQNLSNATLLDVVEMLY